MGRGGHNFIDRIGQVFDRLTVISRAENTPYRKARWLCQCSCGSTVVVVGPSLSQGRSRSCGCLHRELVVERNRTHGESHRGKQTPEYKTWASMIARCTSPHNTSFKHYGGRGIRVCQRWEKFEIFLADILATISRKPNGKSLDRIDNGGNYEPGNVRWATRSEQALNTRRSIPTIKVREVKRLARQGGISLRGIAMRVGVSQSHVGRIARGEAWASVE